MTDKTRNPGTGCISIPPAALEAGARAAMDDAGWHWDTADEARRDIWRRTTRAAFVAMVEAWPEAKRVKGYFTHDTDYYEPAFILPLTENPDDKA